MNTLKLTFTRTAENEEVEINEIADSVEEFVDISHCGMEWADPETTADGWKTGWLFFPRNEVQKESVRSMLEDLVRDYPNILTLTNF